MISNVCWPGITGSETYRCDSNNFITRRCSDSKCLTNCKDLLFSHTSSCVDFSGFVGGKQYAQISCEAQQEIPQTPLGGWRIESSPGSCTTSRQKSSITGQGLCLPLTTGGKSVRTYCSENRTVVEDSFWFRGDCSGIPSQRRVLWDKELMVCSDNSTMNLIANSTLVQCKPMRDMNSDWMAWMTLPLGLALVVGILIWGVGRVLNTAIFLISCQFGKAFKSLRITSIFRNHFLSEFFACYFITWARVISNVLALSTNIGLFIAMVLYCVWWNQDRCPQDVPFLSIQGIRPTFGLICAFLGISCIYNVFVFTSTFLFAESDDEETSGFIYSTNNKIYTIDTSSSWFKNISRTTWLTFYIDLLSLYSYLQFTVINLVGFVYGVVVLRHVWYSSFFTVCNETRILPIALGLTFVVVFILNIVLLTLFFIYGVLLLIPTCAEWMAGCICSRSPTEEKQPLLKAKDKDYTKDLGYTSIKNWNRKQFALWLRLQSLGQYESKMSIFPMKTLMDLNYQDLQENGITDVFHQQSLYAAIHTLDFEHPWVYNPYSVETWTTTHVVEFLQKLEISNVQNIVKKYALNGAFLKVIQDGELARILGVNTESEVENHKMRYIIFAIFSNPRFFESKDYQCWGKAKVENWIKHTLELAQYSKFFLNHNVFGAMLPSINNDECFKELGIAPEHYRSFQTAMLNLEHDVLPVSKVYKWARELQIESKDCDNIRKFGIHSAMLLSLDEKEIFFYFPSLEKNRLKKNSLINEMEGLAQKYQVNARPKHIQETRGEVKMLNSLEGSAPQFGSDDVVDNCAVCKMKPKSLILLPCEHMAICDSCSKAVEDCPLCGSHIESTSKPFR